MINPGPVVLVTCGKLKHDIITIAWITPVSHKPPMLAISVGRNRYSRQLIEEEGEFVVNIPSTKLLDTVWFCGTRSGREVDKFVETGLSKIDPQFVSPPLIAECMAWLECRVRKKVEVGDHILFIGEILCASARTDAFNHFYKLNPSNETLHHLGGKNFATLGRRIETREGA